ARRLRGLFVRLHVAGNDLDQRSAPFRKMRGQAKLSDNHDLVAHRIERKHRCHPPQAQHVTALGDGTILASDRKLESFVVAKTLAKEFRGRERDVDGMISEQLALS